MKQQLCSHRGRKSKQRLYHMQNSTEVSRSSSFSSSGSLFSLRMSGIHPSELDATGREQILIFIESHRKFRHQASVVHIEEILDRNMKVVFISCMSRVRPFGLDMAIEESFLGPRPQFVQQAQTDEMNMLEIKLSKFRGQLRSLKIELEIVCSVGISSERIVSEEAHRRRPMWIAIHNSFPKSSQLEEMLPEDCSVAIIGNSPVQPIYIMREIMLGGRSATHSGVLNQPDEADRDRVSGLEQIPSMRTSRQSSVLRTTLSFQETTQTDTSRSKSCSCFGLSNLFRGNRRESRRTVIEELIEAEMAVT